MISDARLSMCLYAAVDRPEPYPIDGFTWAQIIECIGPPKPYLTKEAANLFGPHRLLPGTTRAKDNVTAITFAVLDFDKNVVDQTPLPQSFHENVLSEIHGQIPYVFATTFSHEGPHKMKARLFMPMSRDVLPSEWPKLWAVLNRKIAKGNADPSCKSLERAYYQPAYKEGGSVAPIYIRSDEGRALDVDTLLLEAPATGDSPISLGSTPTKESLRWYASILGKNKKTEKLGEALYRVVAGEAFAPAGERDDTLFKLCSKIVSRWPTLDVTQTAELFSNSLQLMGGDAPDLANVADKLTRLQRGVMNERATKISRALCNGRSDPYSLDELQEFAGLLDCDIHQLRNRWVIQRGSSFYVFVHGRYEHYSDRDVSSAADVLLAPAITAQVDTRTQTEDGKERRLKSDELVEKYGTVVQSIEVDLQAQVSHLDYHRRVFVEAPCPLRVKESVYDAEIAKWLEVFSGDQHQKVLEWIAAATVLDKPCAALYLMGAPDVGKSLFASGLAKLWVHDGSPPSLREVFADFNDYAMRCPLIFQDEALPEQRVRLTSTMTARLRELISSRARPLNRKFQPTATLKGAMRLVLAANNKRMVKTQEEMSQYDIAALAQRFVHVEIPDETVSFLGQVQKPWRWVEDDTFAKHALWLRDNVKLPENQRFLVKGESEDFVRTLTVGTFLVGQISLWLVNFLQNPLPLRQNVRVRHLVRVRGGKLLVNAKVIAEQWSDYVSNDKNPPDATAVARSLTTLSTGRELLEQPNGYKLWYRVIDLDTLGRWATEHGWADLDALAQALVDLDEIPEIVSA